MAEASLLRVASLFALALLVTVAYAGDLRASEEDAEGEDKKQERVGYSIPAGEKHEGDLYTFRPTVRIAGEQHGDVVAFTQSLTVNGTWDGDLFVGAQTVDISGTVGDSARTFAQTVTVSGTVDGDLLSFAGITNLLPSSRVTGDVGIFGQNATVQGTIERGLKFTGGQVTIAGHVHGDVHIKCDQIQVEPGAKIDGSLRYTARNRLDLDGKGIVGGEVDYEEKKAKEEEEEEKPVLSTWKIVKFFMLMASSFLVGLVALKVVSGPTSRAVATVALTPLWSAGVGFIALIVTPVAAVLLVVFIVTIPLAVVLLLLWLIGLYVAKIPVAVWLGNRLLHALGRPSPSAVWSLLLGLLLLYPLFSIPWCLGKMIWLACTFVGLGAIVSGAREPRPAASAPGGGSPAQPAAPPAPQPV